MNGARLDLVTIISLFVLLLLIPFSSSGQSVPQGFKPANPSSTIGRAAKNARSNAYILLNQTLSKGNISQTQHREATSALDEVKFYVPATNQSDKQCQESGPGFLYDASFGFYICQSYVDAAKEEGAKYAASNIEHDLIWWSGLKASKDNSVCEATIFLLAYQKAVRPFDIEWHTFGRYGNVCEVEFAPYPYQANARARKERLEACHELSPDVSDLKLQSAGPFAYAGGAHATKRWTIQEIVASTGTVESAVRRTEKDMRFVEQNCAADVTTCRNVRSANRRMLTWLRCYHNKERRGEIFGAQSHDAHNNQPSTYASKSKGANNSRTENSSFTCRPDECEICRVVNGQNVFQCLPRQGSSCTAAECK